MRVLTQWRLIPLLVPLVLGGPAMAAHGPPVKWTAHTPDRSKPAAGYAVLEDVEHFKLYHATSKTGLYCHHPQIAWHAGTFYATWSNHRDGEDGPGQRVLGSLSKDGRTWEPFFEAFPPIGPVRRPEEQGLVLTANGLLVLGGGVYAIAEVNDNIGFTDVHKKHYSETKTKECRFRARRGYGRLARSVSPAGALGPAFWLVESLPEDAKDVPSFPFLTDRRFAAVGRKLCDLLAQPLNTPAWDFRDKTAWTTAADGNPLCEPTVYQRPDGVYVRLSRDLMHSKRLYASLSRDGREWSTPVATNIPDSPSKSRAGSLPDGRVFLIGNQTKWGRDPLVLSLSADGVIFDWAAAIRHGAPKLRHKGLHKGAGFQYASAVVVGDALWVIYSVGKEDVAVSRVPLASLPTGP
jgi:hypothetical protein